MFRKKKGDEEGTEAPAPTDTVEVEISPPPLKPFSKKGSHGPSKPPPAASFRPEIPRRAVEIPGGPRQTVERARPGDDDAKRLLVGREICLNGKITSCDKLVVEGHVEASLSDARIIEVTPSGYFKGNAEVDEADISGRYEGELIAREKLTVRAEGRISGSIRYGRIIIESGGEISGDMQSLGQGDRNDSTESPALNPSGRSFE